MREVSIHVPGQPRPQGSKRGFLSKSGHVVVAESNVQGLARYRADIREAWERAPETARMPKGPTRIWVTFRFTRPKTHVGAKGLLGSAPKRMTSQPDTDKLTRAVMDALTGLAFSNDSHVWEVIAQKEWTQDPSETHISVGVDE